MKSFLTKKTRKITVTILITLSFWCSPLFAQGSDETEEDDAEMSPPKEITSHLEKGPDGNIITKVIQQRRGTEYIIKVQVIKQGRMTETVHHFDSPNFYLEVPITERITSQVQAGAAKHPDARIATFTQKLDIARQSMLRTDYVSALKYVNEALLIDDQNPQAHMMKGSIYYAMGKYDLASAEYDLVLKLEPNNTEVLQFKKYMEEKTSQREKINVEPK